MIFSLGLGRMKITKTRGKQHVYKEKKKGLCNMSVFWAILIYIFGVFTGLVLMSLMAIQKKDYRYLQEEMDIKQ